MIECAFEGPGGRGFDSIVHLDQKTVDLCEAFNCDRCSARGKVVAIMKNIVANGGTFKP